MSKLERFERALHLGDTTFVYGYINEGADKEGRDYGSRYFVLINGEPIPAQFAEAVVKLLQRIDPVKPNPQEYK